MLLGALIAVGGTAHSTAQDAWDYTPYRIRVWLAVRPSAAVGPRAPQRDYARRWRRWLPCTAVRPGSWKPRRLRRRSEPAWWTAALDELTVRTRSAQAREECSGSRQVDAAVVCEEARCILDRVSRTGLSHADLGVDGAHGAWQPCAAGTRCGRCRRRRVSAVWSAWSRRAARRRACGCEPVDWCGMTTARSLVKTGDVLRPVIRRNDRRGEPKPGGIEVLEWTYLLVREPQDYLLDCDVYSASRNPLVGRSSTNRRTHGARVRPHGRQHRHCNWWPAAMSPQPLEGYEIVAKKPVAEEAADPNPSVRLGLTDWRGMIAVERIGSPVAVDLRQERIASDGAASDGARIPAARGHCPCPATTSGWRRRRL